MQRMPATIQGRFLHRPETRFSQSMIFTEMHLGMAAGVRERETKMPVLAIKYRTHEWYITAPYAALQGVLAALLRRFAETLLKI